MNCNKTANTAAVLKFESLSIMIDNLIRNANQIDQQTLHHFTVTIKPPRNSLKLNPTAIDEFRRESSGTCEQFLSGQL
jgi:hypothetical protein